MATTFRSDFAGKGKNKSQLSHWWRHIGTFFISAGAGAIFAFLAGLVGYIIQLPMPAFIGIGAAVFVVAFIIALRYERRPPERGIRFANTHHRKAQSVGRQ